MQKIAEALVSHADLESEALDVRLPDGSWVDVYDLLEPFIKAWAEIGNLANTDALDEAELIKDDRPEFIKGRSSMAHSVLRIMAAAEDKVAEL